MKEDEKYDDYNSEPVEYCARCYSLKIKREDSIDADCCMDCGSTEMAFTDIRTWERLYANRYGHTFIQKGNGPRNSIYYKMTLGELKSLMFHSNYFYPVVYSLYPGFPKGLTKSEAVIVLFDKLSKDGRIDDLRNLLYKKNKELKLG